MRWLLIDPAGASTLLAHLEAGVVRRSVEVPGASVLVELPGAVAGLEMGPADGLAVCLGPGPYNALRVGITFAASLAWARAVPLVAWNAFELLAATAPGWTPAVAAGRGNWAIEEPAGAIALVPASGLPLRTVIDGRDPEPSGFSGTLRRLPVAERLAVAALMAEQRWRAGLTRPADRLEPIYARPPTITAPRRPPAGPARGHKPGG